MDGEEGRGVVPMTGDEPLSVRPVPDQPEADVVHLAFGTAAMASDLIRWTGRTALGTVRRVPGVAGPLDSALAVVSARGRDVARTTETVARAVLRMLIREVVAAALREVDLTRIVREYVDLNLIASDIDVDTIAERIDVDKIARRLDLDAVVRRLDLDGIVDAVDLDRQVARVDLDRIAGRIDLNRQVARVDLIALANEIIEGVDLPHIIRESTGSLSSEAVQGMRSQGMHADDAVAGFIGRLLGREGSEPHGGSEPHDGPGRHRQRSETGRSEGTGDADR